MNMNGNHSHSVWRDFQNGDFGEDLLRARYAEVPHEGVSPRAPWSVKSQVTSHKSQTQITTAFAACDL
ncbi:MAG: hypothetical protein HYY76_08685 [Acidobacteria bacterium]|nr:hypothetical protein [Acidobacteriota bacterium]